MLSFVKTRRFIQGPSISSALKRNATSLEKKRPQASLRLNQRDKYESPMEQRANPKFWYNTRNRTRYLSILQKISTLAPEQVDQEVDPVHQTLLLSVHARNEAPEKALVLFDKMMASHEPVPAQAFHIMIDMWCHLDAAPRVLELWKQMEIRGVIPDSHSWFQVCNMLSRLEHYDQLTVFYETLCSTCNDELPANFDMLRLKMSVVFAEQLQFKRSFQILCEVNAPQLFSFKRKMYLEILQVIRKHQQLDQLGGIFETLGEDYKRMPQLISFFCSKGLPVQAMFLYNQFRKTAHLSTKLLSSLLSVVCELRLSHDAQLIFMDAKAAGKCPVGFYNRLMSMHFHLQNKEEALSLLTKMIQDGVEPDTVTNNILLHHGFGLPSNLKQPPKDNFSYNTQLHQFATNHEAERGQELFYWMRDEGFVDSCSYGTMIKLYSNCQMVKEAEKLYQEAKSMGMADLLVHSSMITLYGLKTNNHEKAVAALSGMLESGIQPDLRLYTILSQMNENLKQVQQ